MTQVMLHCWSGLYRWNMLSSPRDSGPATQPGQRAVNSNRPAAREGRRARRSRELRDRIYRTAQALFLEHGFEATTVSQIAEAADIAQATFFNHFRCKAAILSAMTDEVFVHMEMIVDEELSRPGTPADRVMAFVRRVAAEILNVNGLAKDVLLELLQIGAQRGDVAPHAVGLLAPFEEMYRAGQEQGTVRIDLDATFLSEFAVGALNTTVMNWLMQEDYPLLRRLETTATLIAESTAPRRAELDPPT
jgi:AcrR family transcriptional regulator